MHLNLLRPRFSIFPPGSTTCGVNIIRNAFKLHRSSCRDPQEGRQRPDRDRTDQVGRGEREREREREGEDDDNDE